MRNVLISIVTGVAALVAAAPAAAQHNAASAAPGYHRSPLETALTARLQSIQTRILLLREEGLMNSEEARDLRQQSRSIEQRLIGLNARDASDVELAVSRLNDRVRFAAEESRWGSHVFERDDADRYEAGRLERLRENDFQVERHVAPPVDRWGDPFDRGDEL
jgi:hypothetical protein